MRQIASISRLISELSQLPGIGHKTAQRLAFHIVDIPNSKAVKLADAIVDVKRHVRYCDKCFNITDRELCHICENPSRDQTVICVVESARDLLAIEKTHSFKGVYHVLLGAISPLDNIGPDQIKIAELISRIGKEDVSELLIATNPTVEGEATALYISRMLKNVPDLEISRIAHGVPIGGDLEYTDEVTLAKSIEGRRKI